MNHAVTQAFCYTLPVHNSSHLHIICNAGLLSRWPDQVNLQRSTSLEDRWQHCTSLTRKEQSCTTAQMQQICGMMSVISKWSDDCDEMFGMVAMKCLVVWVYDGRKLLLLHSATNGCCNSLCLVSEFRIPRKWRVAALNACVSCML